MNTLGDRLKLLLATKKIRAISFADQMERPRGTISNYMIDRTIPNADFFQDLAKLIPDINLNWLITGQGEMLFREQTAELLQEDSRVSQLEQQLSEMKKQQDAIMMAFSGLTNFSTSKPAAVEQASESVRSSRHKTKLGSFSGAVRQTGNRRYSFLLSRSGSC